MHRRLVEDVDEIFITEDMIESDDVGMWEESLYFYFFDEFSDIVWS